MKRTIIVEAKKVEDAIKQGLAQLNTNQDDVEIKILSTGGWFKKAKVEMSIEVPDYVSKITTPTELKKEAIVDEVKVETQPIKTEKVIESKKTVQVEKTATQSEPIVSEKPQDKPKAKNQDKPQGKPVALKNPTGEKTATQSKPVASEKPQDKQKSGNSKRKNDKRRERACEPITEEVAQKAVGFVGELVNLMGIDCTVSHKIAKGLTVNIETVESCIIGHHGETLDAIEYLTLLIVNGNSKGYSQIEVDALNYRAKRVNTLKRIADEMANKCIESDRRVALKPMNSVERKIIHAHLSENDSVITKSDGKEPARKVVIFPKK